MASKVLQLLVAAEVHHHEPLSSKWLLLGRLGDSEFDLQGGRD
jgi:hypothetical protein